MEFIEIKNCGSDRILEIVCGLIRNFVSQSELVFAIKREIVKNYREIGVPFANLYPKMTGDFIRIELSESEYSKVSPIVDKVVMCEDWYKTRTLVGFKNGEIIWNWERFELWEQGSGMGDRAAWQLITTQHQFSPGNENCHHESLYKKGLLGGLRRKFLFEIDEHWNKIDYQNEELNCQGVPFRLLNYIESNQGE